MESTIFDSFRVVLSKRKAEVRIFYADLAWHLSRGIDVHSKAIRLQIPRRCSIGNVEGDHQCSAFDDDDHFREQELNIVALAISNESTKVVFASCCPNVVMFYFFIAEQSA